jgi:DNA helicase-2/ATP-dependent DNA helicase PcrA
VHIPEPDWPDEDFELFDLPVDVALEEPFDAPEGRTGELPDEPPPGLDQPPGDDLSACPGDATISAPAGAASAGASPARPAGGPAHSLLDLNPEQLEAVEAPGPVALVAPPGSGKTRTLAGRVCRILQDAAPQSVLAVTFTRYAAGEMRDQVRAVVGDAADAVHISTLHALGYGIVRAEADRLGLSGHLGVALPSYAHTLLRKAARAAGLDERWDLDGLAREIERAKGNLLGPDEYRVYPGDAYSETVARVYRIYQETLREKNVVDFGDMIRLAVRALEANPEARGFYQALYRYVLVDEWQDTNSAQYRLVRLLVGRQTDLFVVGDPLQSIYAWRGADPAVFQALAADFPSARQLQLRVNYRSTETIAAASEGIVRALGLPPRDLVARGGPGEPLALVRCDTERDEALQVAEELAQLAGAGEWGYNQCAVLVRTVRQARLIEQALLRSRVPYTLAGQGAFFDTRVVRELLAWLRLAGDPFDGRALETALNAPPRGLGKATKEQLRAGAFRLTMEALLAAPEREDLPERARRGVAEFLGMVDEVHAARERPLPALLDYVLQRTGYAAWLRKSGNGNGNGGDPGDEVPLDPIASAEADAVHNLRLLLEGYRGDALSRRVEPAETSSKGDDGLARCLRDAEEMQAGAASDGKTGVFLGTIHAAKGLEWPVVFLPGLDEGLLPHAKSLLDKKRLEEEHRLFYVALTRAMQKVVLLGARYRTNARGQGWECRPSRFLGYLPPETVRRE